MRASSVSEIHWPGGASMRHLRSMQNDSVAVCLLQRCGGSLYYRNIICIAGAVDMVAIELFVCFFFNLKGCNVPMETVLERIFFIVLYLPLLYFPQQE